MNQALARRRAWMIVFLILVMLAAVVALAGAGLLKWWINQSKSEAYKMALEMVVNDPRVVEALGEPIVEKGKPKTDESVEGDQGRSSITFMIEGPKGIAGGQVQARMIDGKWGLTSLDVTPPGGEKIIIDTSANVEPDAPMFSPQDSAPSESPGSETAPPTTIELPPPSGIDIQIPDLPQ